MRRFFVLSHMSLPQFTQTAFLNTMIAPMSNVTETAEAVVDIWSHVHGLTEMVPALVIERELIEAV